MTRGSGVCKKKKRKKKEKVIKGEGRCEEEGEEEKELIYRDWASSRLTFVTRSLSDLSPA